MIDFHPSIFLEAFKKMIHKEIFLFRSNKKCIFIPPRASNTHSLCSSSRLDIGASTGDEENWAHRYFEMLQAERAKRVALNLKDSTRTKKTSLVPEEGPVGQTSSPLRVRSAKSAVPSGLPEKSIGSSSLPEDFKAKSQYPKGSSR